MTTTTTYRTCTACPNPVEGRGLFCNRCDGLIPEFHRARMRRTFNRLAKNQGPAFGRAVQGARKCVKSILKAQEKKRKREAAQASGSRGRSSRPLTPASR